MRTESAEGGPRPVIAAGMSSPAVTLSALLFSVVLSMAAPRPLAARYTAATAFGRLVTAASTTPPVMISGTAKRVPGSDGDVPAAAVRRVDDLLQLLLLLGDGGGEPGFPPPRQGEALQAGVARAEHGQVGQQDREHRDQPGRGRNQAEHRDQAGHRDP